MTNIQDFVKTHAGKTETVEKVLTNATRIRIGLDLGKIQAIELNFTTSKFDVARLNDLGDFFDVVAPRYVIDSDRRKKSLFTMTPEVLRDQVFHIIEAINKVSHEYTDYQAINAELMEFLQDLQEADAFLEETVEA